MVQEMSSFNAEGFNGWRVSQIVLASFNAYPVPKSAYYLGKMFRIPEFRCDPFEAS